MEQLINIVDIESLRTALATDPSDGEGQIDMKIAWLTGVKEHPDYEIVTHVQDGKTYRLYYIVYIDENSNIKCRFSHLQMVQ